RRRAPRPARLGRRRAGRARLAAARAPAQALAAARAVAVGLRARPRARAALCSPPTAGDDGVLANRALRLQKCYEARRVVGARHGAAFENVQELPGFGIVGIN